MVLPERATLVHATDDRVFYACTAAATMATILGLVPLAMNRLVARPLHGLSDIIDGLGSGLFDFSVQGTRRNDEVGDIARAVDRLQESGLDIARLHEAGGDLEFKRQHDRRAELDELSHRFSSSIETVVATIGGASMTVEARSRDVSTATRSTQHRLHEVAEATSAARGDMASAAEATDSLLATIVSIGDRSRGSRIATENVERNAAATDLSLAQLRLTISDIDTVAILIRDVAAQIDLIALNATIESARAGAAGRGFAVVAAEIKSLAKRTAKATEDISRHIAAVRSASGIAGANVLEMNDSIHDLRSISSDIAQALSVQTTATEDIRDLVSRAQGSSDGVCANVVALVKSSDSVHGATGIMLAQCASFGTEITVLNREVAGFLQTLRTARTAAE